jgi:hypothetical protein
MSCACPSHPASSGLPSKQEAEFLFFREFFRIFHKSLFPSFFPLFFIPLLKKGNEKIKENEKNVDEEKGLGKITLKRAKNLHSFLFLKRQRHGNVFSEEKVFIRQLREASGEQPFLSN